MSRFSEPSGGGTTVAEERPGAGVGAQTSVGAAADVPEATQKGAGASDLTTPQDTGAAAGTGAAAQAGASASAQPGASAAGQASLAANAQSSTIQAGTTNMVVPLYQESLQVGKREVDQGSVKIRKYVTTETVNQPLTVRRETVTVDRAPAGSQLAQGGTAAPAQPQGQVFQEQEIVIPLRREEPVVSKQVVPGGQIIARVQTQVQQTNVQGQVRREQVQVTKSGDAQNVVISENLTSQQGGAAMGGGGQVGSGGQSTGAAAGGGSTITDLSTLSSASDPAAFAGRTVRLSNAKVQAVLGDNLVAIRDNSGQTHYVHLNQPAQNLQEGDTISFNGTVQRVPSDVSNLGLSGEASHVLQGQPIYIQAQQIQVSNQ